MISGISSPDFETTASFVDQSAAYAAQIDSLEKKLADVLREFKRLKTAASPSVLSPAVYEAVESRIQELTKTLESLMAQHNVSQDIRSRFAATNAQLRLIDSQLSAAGELHRALSEGCRVPEINNASQRRLEYLAAEADPLVLRAESLRASERSRRMGDETSTHPSAAIRRIEENLRQRKVVLEGLENELKVLEDKVRQAKRDGDPRKIKSAEYNVITHKAKIAVGKRGVEAAEAEFDQYDMREKDDGKWER
jgi:uncharacterized coiled-coil DUF342 family protein